MYINLFKNGIRQIEGGQQIELDNFLQDVRRGKWQDDIIDYGTGKKKKEELPYVTISGLFTKRKNDGLTAHSGFICIDVDDVDPDEIKGKIEADGYVYAAFTTVSQRGVAIIFRIKPDKHLESYLWLEDYLYGRYQIIADRQCKDVSRPRICSYDPTILVNRSASVVPFKKLEKQRVIAPVLFAQNDFEFIIQEITSRRINLCENYQEWLHVGFALSHQFGEAGRAYFHALSSISAKYNPQTCDRQFTNCIRHNGDGITIASLYWMAKNHGIQCYSPQTKKIGIAAYQAKKSGRQLEDVIDLLKESEGIPEEESRSLVEQVFSQKIRIDDDEGIMSMLEAYIQQNYRMRRNVINRKIFLENGRVLDDQLINSIYVNAKKIFDKDVTSEMIVKLINSDFTPTFNPLFDFIDRNRHIECEGTIEEYLRCFDVEDFTSFRLFFKKWWVSTIATIYGNESPLFLVFVGPQNCGKTRALRELLPEELREQFYAESKLDREKDDEILMTQRLIICDDEMAGKSRRDYLKVKSLTSKRIFTLREPYGKANVDLRRLAMLCGTTNEDELLDDPTGNRRILPVKIRSIDFKKINKVDRVKLFIEAYQLYVSGFKYEMSQADIEALTSATGQFRDFSEEYELIVQHFKKPYPGCVPVTMSSTEVVSYLSAKSVGVRLSRKKVGMELQALGFDQTLVKEGGISSRKWRLVKIELDIPKNPFDSPYQDEDMPF